MELVELITRRARRGASVRTETAQDLRFSVFSLSVVRLAYLPALRTTSLPLYFSKGDFPRRAGCFAGQLPRLCVLFVVQNCCVCAQRVGWLTMHSCL